MVLPRFDDLVVSTSATTRARRAGEREGREYYFITRAEFLRRVDEGEFLEWAEYGGNLYGTPRAPVEAALQSGRDVILEIELQGAYQVHDKMPAAVMIFVSPPDLDELETRLRRRRTEDEDQIRRRLDHAHEELSGRDSEGKPPEFDYAIVNDDAQAAADELARVIEEIRSRDPERRSY